MTLVHTEPELVLKSTPPRLQKLAEQRTRLSLESLSIGDQLAMLVQAPAGFGKTQLLAQWRREWLLRGGVVIWLTLDEHDDALRFVQGLAVAKVRGCGRAAGLRRGGQLLGKATEFDELTGWLAEVADLGSETLLILDDAHALPVETVQHGFTYLLRNAPTNLHVAIASRTRIALPMSELLTHGLCVQVGAEDLRFTLDETLALLNGRFGARLTVDSAARLHEVTEGWPLGLQLAISAIERSRDLQMAIGNLVAGDGNIQRYFIDSLSAAQVDFLVRIALFDQVHPELCQVLLADLQAVERLHELAGSTPILIEGLDSEWLRIHPLAYELLRGRFAQLPAPVRHTLHQRAAAWLAGRGLNEEAARQAFLAGKTEQAYALIESCLYEIMLGGQPLRVLEWVEQLPSAEVEQRPRLRLAVAWSLAMSERSDEAIRLAGQIGADPDLADEDRYEADAIAITAAYYSDQWDLVERLIQPWLNRLPKSVKLRAMLENQRARLAIGQGHPEWARHYCQQAPRYDWTTGMDTLSGHREWIFGLSYWWAGQMRLAEQVLRPSLSQADRDIGWRSGVAMQLATVYACVLLERDAISEANSVLANRMGLLVRLAAPEAIAQGYLASARLAAIQSQPHRAQDLLEELFILGQTRGLPRLSICSLAEQIRLHALRGHSETCQKLWGELETQLTPCVREGQGLLGRELSLYVRMAQLHVLAVQRDWSGLLQLLEPVAQLAERLRRGREGVQIQLFRALARQRLGEDALPALREALGLADELGLSRILADTHPDLPACVGQLDDEPGTGLAVKEAKPASSAQAQASIASPTGMLTPKEREVLQLLAQNLANKQIAAAMGISEETVKWHMKNLLGKFQAGTRKHLVARAQLLGILHH